MELPPGVCLEIRIAFATSSRELFLPLRPLLVLHSLGSQWEESSASHGPTALACRSEVHFCKRCPSSRCSLSYVALREAAVHGVGVRTFRRVPPWAQPLGRWLTSHLGTSSTCGHFPAPPLKKGASPAAITILYPAFQG